MAAIVEYLTPHYILNFIVCTFFPLTRLVSPVCETLYELNEDGTCAFDYRDIEVMMFLCFVVVLKNRRWRPLSNREYISNLFLFSKCANLLLFLRHDLRWGFLYGLLCFILFIAFPEPSYCGPDNVQYFRGSGLDEELLHNPDKIYLVEFYAAWSPPCARFSSTFAKLSLRYGNDYFKFGKLDVTKYQVIGNKYKIDSSVSSKNLPTLVLFANGKEKMRRPALNYKGAVTTPYVFKEENVIQDFNLNEIYADTKEKKIPSKLKHKKTK